MARYVNGPYDPRKDSMHELYIVEYSDELEDAKIIIQALADSVPELNTEYWKLQEMACDYLRKYRE